jgi:ribonuclease HI
LSGPKFVGAAGAYAYQILHEAWDPLDESFRPERMITEKSVFMPAKPEQTRVTVSYHGYIDAMDWLTEDRKTAHHVRFFSDEIRMINQITRRWKPKGDNYVLWKKFDYVRCVFKDIGFIWLRDDRNPAIAMAKKTLIDNGVDPETFPKHFEEEAAAY